MVKIGIIGGTGIYSPSLFQEKEKVKIFTPFGEPSSPLRIASVNGVDIAFLARHGEFHTLPPHKVNYKANVWALKEVGVERVIGIGAVGSLREEYKPGDIVICDQFIDMTKRRESSFYDGGKVVHINISEPFCKELREILIKLLEKLGYSFHQKGCYICIEGPRFSTKAESKLWRLMGADVIGMTLLPEVVLARELGMCYVCVATVTDWDVWKEREVSAQEVLRIMKESNRKIMEILKEFIPLIKERKCGCGDVLKGAEL